MKYNTTYTPKMTLQATLKAIEFLKNELLKKINNKYLLLKISAPLFTQEDSDLLINLSNITRPINFDIGNDYQVASMYLSHTNWLRQMMDETSVQMGEGLIIETKSVWRDLKDNPVGSQTKEEIILQVKVRDSKNIQADVKELAQDVYEFFYLLAIQVENKYKIKNIFPKYAPYFSSQMLENEMPNETFKQREIETILDQDAYILVGPGARLFSGKSHTYVPPELYELKNFYNIIIKDRINYDVLKIASIALLANGQNLSDQLGKYNLKEKEQTPFYFKLIKQKDKIIEIKFNIPRLMMALLEKGHIGEVQPGIISKNAKIIREKYKINIIK